MNKQKALEITKDRIEYLKIFIPKTESEEKTAKETLDYLKFIENLLEG